MNEYSVKPKMPMIEIGEPQNQFLTDHQVAMIDEALCSIGEFGEIRLIVEKGKLRFIVTQRSYDALKWQPGGIHQPIE